MQLLLRLVDNIALLDMLLAFADLARTAPRHAEYTRPQLHTRGRLLAIVQVGRVVLLGGWSYVYVCVCVSGWQHHARYTRPQHHTRGLLLMIVQVGGGGGVGVSGPLECVCAMVGKSATSSCRVPAHQPGYPFTHCATRQEFKFRNACAGPPPPPRPAGLYAIHAQ